MRSRIAAIIGLLLALTLWSGSAVWAATANFQVEIIPGPECYDGLDNDGDGEIDHPDDDGCDSPADDDETDPGPVCGDAVCASGESCASCPADCGACGGGGGGGGGTPPPASTQVNLSGRAYPFSPIKILQDGQPVASTAAGSDGFFTFALEVLTAGNYHYSMYAGDYEERRSSLFSFTLGIARGSTTNVSGIFLAPTIDTDKAEVKQGDPVVILGQAFPGATVTISVNSEEQHFITVTAGPDGTYYHEFDTSVLELGQHFTKSKAATDGEESPFGTAVAFLVGDKNLAKPTDQTCGKADLNCDGRVDLVDFSLAAYWFNRELSADFIALERERLSEDGRLDLVDFSIMAYYWTG
jgi:hypothetical protein